MNSATSSGAQIATAIRMRLAELNRSQRWLADRLDRSTYWVSRRLSGQVAMSFDDVDEFASALGVNAFDLMDTARRRDSQKAA